VSRAGREEADAAVAVQTMTHEQRKSVALEYLKAFDNGGVTSTGASILDLFAEDAQVHFPKWGVANGRDEIGRMFGEVGGRLKAIRHDYANFNWIRSRRHVRVRGNELRRARGRRVARGRDARGTVVRRLRGPRLPHPALLHLPRPDYAGRDTDRYPWLAADGRDASVPIG
jgi:hypothetical protein